MNQTSEGKDTDRPEAALAPQPVRTFRARLFQIYFLAAALAFAILAFLARGAGHFTLDLSITRGVQSVDAAWFDRLMRAVSFFGYSPQATILVTAVVLLLFGLGLRWEALLAALAGVTAGLLGVLAKLVIARPRPTADLVDVLRDLADFSFPSGHVVLYTIFFGFLWFLSYTLLKRSLLRTLLLVSLSGLVALVGLSRVYLGVHWASDAFGGYLLGSLALLVLVGLYRRGSEKG